ncbi:hypothetical protein ST37_10635 [Vibrio sp. qd031]|nr:hypothetical protein ST37_10635 [Vibrio sp. qd031]
MANMIAVSTSEAFNSLVIAVPPTQTIVHLNGNFVSFLQPRNQIGIYVTALRDFLRASLDKSVFSTYIQVVTF